MNLVMFLLAFAVAINGLLAGLNVDTALVKLPARRRIGAVAYATFARGNESSKWPGGLSHFRYRRGSLHRACHGHCFPGALPDGVALAAFPCFPVESSSHSSHGQSGTCHVEHQGYP